MILKTALRLTVQADVSNNDSETSKNVADNEALETAHSKSAIIMKVYSTKLWERKADRHLYLFRIGVQKEQ